MDGAEETNYHRTVSASFPPCLTEGVHPSDLRLSAFIRGLDSFTLSYLDFVHQAAQQWAIDKRLKIGTGIFTTSESVDEMRKSGRRQYRRDEREQAEQNGTGASDGQVRPLPLGFEADMGADLLEVTSTCQRWTNQVRI